MKKPLTWIIILLVLIILLLLGIVLGWWGGSSDPDPEPTPTATGTPTATSAPTTPPNNIVANFVPRPVTTSGRAPSASALTGEVLETVGANWVVAIHNGDSYDDGGSFEPGAAILYLISPTADRYELANLDTLGFDSIDLVAWNYGDFQLMLVEDGAEMNVFDMVTGAVTQSWDICGQSTTVRGRADGNGWVLRGSCEGEGFDGRYSDDGFLASSNTIGEGFGNFVVDVGDVQVLNGFETPPSERLRAFYADGTKAYLTMPGSGDCYPIGKGRGATIAVQCYGSGAQPDIYEVPVDGSAAKFVVSAAQIETFQASTIGTSEFLSVSGYCADSKYIALETTSVQSQLGVLSGPDLVPGVTSPYFHESCHGAIGTKALVSGNGPLWWIDWADGTATVELLPGAGDSWPLYVVGASETTALYYPAP